MGTWEPSDGEEKRGMARSLSRAFAIVVGVLVLVLAAGTIYGLATGSREKKLARAAEAAKTPAGSYVYSGIGTVRASTKDNPAAVVVATVSFPYPADDRSFAEELDTKTEALRAAAVDYFSAKTAAELAPAYEGSVKAGLKDRLNGLLSLGKVEDIWLSDFSVVQ
jgi:flagellar basal body-associated protein FliL